MPKGHLKRRFPGTVSGECRSDNDLMRRCRDGGYAPRSRGHHERKGRVSMRKSMIAVLLAGSMSLGACTSVDDARMADVGTGAAIGAAGGAGVGALVGGVGVVEGAVVGAAI